MRLYQAGDGQWIVLNNETKTYFSTQAEALAMADKIKFATSVINTNKQIAQVMEQLPTFKKVWDLDDFLNTMIDADIESTGATKAEITAFITFAENFLKFMRYDSGAPDPPALAMYQDTIYNLLQDPNLSD